MPSKGFITIDRCIEDWRWWGNPTAMSLWLYILVKANWKDGWWKGGNEPINRGEFVTSQLKISEELGLNRRTVSRYLKEFEKDNQIRLEVNNSRTKIIVINYAKFQDLSEDDAQPTAQLNAQQSTQPSTQQDAQPTAHNRTIKPLNQETIIKKKEDISNEISKKEKQKFVPPTVEEVQAYCDERHNFVDPEMFVDHYTANGWVQGKGKPIKDWKAAVRTWEKNDQAQRNVKQPKRKSLFEDLPF